MGRICSDVLSQARRLAASGNFGGPLNHMLSRATDVLDDLDEILVVLDPKRDPNDFALAAALHRELEHVQSLIPGRWRLRTTALHLATVR